jgi:ADP-heptose:LPS heptosyltransferase
MELEWKDIIHEAGMLRSLDLMISVDTMPAHLAGALAVPVWLLLHSTPDWRWMLRTEESPWYPTMRLFRQRQAGVWAPVIARVARELRDFKKL